MNGYWRTVADGEILQPGRKVEMDMTTGEQRVWEPTGDATEIRRAILANGFAPVPILTRAKFPTMTNWPALARNATPESVAKWPADHGGTGILCGIILGVDFDVPDAKIADALEFAAMDMLGFTPLRRVGNAPKLLLVYRSADPTQKWMKTPKLFLPDGRQAHVEVRADRQQFVAFGIHPDTDQPYSWGAATPANTPAAALPVIDEPRLRAFLAECERILREHGCTGDETGVHGGTAAQRKSYAGLAPPSAAAVVDLLNRLPNPITTDRAAYLEIGLAANGCIAGLEATGALGDDDAEAIRHAWVQWAARWPDSPGEDVEAEKWDDDISRRDRPLAGWSTLERHAVKSIPGYGAEQAQADFADDSTATPGVAPSDWRRSLQATTTGNVRGNMVNASLAFRHGAKCLAMNLFANHMVYTAVPPWDAGAEIGQRVKETDLLAAFERLQLQGIQVQKQTAADAAVRVALEHGFDPIRDWLDSLEWDGVARIDTWLSVHLGAENTEYVCAVASKMLIASVARIYQPGCQMDTVGLLEGGQGIGKSRSLRTVYTIDGMSVFTDHMPDLTQKDAILQLAGMWCVEFAELDKLNRAESARAKSFISTAIDHVRQPYGRATEPVPRHCVFWGTMNPGGAGYLTDETGNRRYWPVRCGSDRVDLAKLRAVRDQLFAEAVMRYRLGESWWFDEPHMVALQEQEVATRYAEDAWTDRIAEYVADKPETSVSDVLTCALGKPAAQWNQSDSNRAARVLKTLGWSRRHVRTGNRQYAWRYFPAPLASVTSMHATLVTEKS